MSKMTPRPDLAVAEWTSPKSIGMMLMPAIYKAVKTGKQYYMSTHADETAQANRSLGAAPTGGHVVSPSVAFSLTELIVRKSRDFSEIVNQESTIAELARMGKTGVAYGNEARIAAAVMDTVAVPTTSADQATFVLNVQEAVQSIQALGQKAAVVMSQTTFNKVRKYTDMNVDGITFTVNGNQPITDGAQIQYNKMAIAFGCEAVLVGQDKAWYTDITNKDAVAVVALPDANLMPDEETQFGRIFALEQEVTDKVTPFSVEYMEDGVSRSLIVDVASFTEAVVMNDALVAAVALPSAEASA
jgi:hypothetical protein